MQIQSNSYNSFLTQVKSLIRDAQYKALKAVNTEQIQLYRSIGKMIVEKQEQLGWGKAVVEQLSKDLQAEYPGQSGWSARNLWLMKQFYEVYQKNEFLQPLAAEIS